MTREEKISAIYAEMANKEDSFWLRFIANFQDYKDEYFDARELTTLFWREDEDWEVFREAITDGGLLRNHYYLDEDAWYIPHIKRGKVLKIIWHPVMIGDVLRQIRLLAGYALDNDLIKKSDFWNVIAQHNYRITQIWEDFREPIEAQSDECVDYVYSLIPSISME